MGQIALDIEEEIQALKRTVGNCNDEILRHSDEIASLMAENAELKAKNEDAEKEISSLKIMLDTNNINNGDDGVALNHNAYTFMYTTPMRSGPFVAGFSPCLMQYAVFSLFLLDLLKTEKIPPDVATIVRTCQIMAIIISFVVETDMLRALRAVIYKEGFEEMKNEFDGFAPWKFYVSNALMGMQGLLGKFVAFFLIIFADNVFDLLLNFTAVMFVSELDEIVFLLSKAGYVGTRSERLSKKILKTTLPQKPPEGILQHLHVIVYAVIMFAAAIGFAFIASQQDSQGSLAQYVKVQFGDEVDPTLGLFSGCYEKKLNDGWDARVRYVQTKADRGHGYFEYCLKDGLQTWVFANETSDSACDVNFVLRSAEERSTSFDLLDAKGDQWLLRTGNPISDFQLGEVNADRFEIECGNIAINGSSTHSEELCPVLTLNIDDIGFSASYDWARTFVFLEDSNNKEIVQFFQHPVFIAESEPGPEGYEVLFFSGRRWVLARTANLLTQEKPSRMDVVSLFGSSDFWLLDLPSEDALAYVSEAVSQANDRGTPLGLQWYNGRYADGGMFPLADISRPVDGTFRCGKCNSRSNPCLYEGICEVDGTCTCRHGATGKLCEIKPLGDGECNGFFNTESDRFDGGDCCVASCSKPSCGVGDMSVAFGQELEREGAGFPNCRDPSMVPISVLLDTKLDLPWYSDTNVQLTTDELLFQSYTVEVSCEGREKIPLRVALDPDITGSLNETLYLEDKAESCLLSFNGIRSGAGFSISFQVVDGRADSMLSMVEVSNVTLDAIFTIPALYSRCLKEALVGAIDQKHLYTGSYHDEAFAWLNNEMPMNADCSSDPEYLIQRYALVALSAAEEAPESWISSHDHCQWPRVTCDDTSKVVEYKYDGETNGPLEGVLAPEYTLLTHLQRLEVAGITLSPGTIPTEIGGLTGLSALIIPVNSRFGTIPSELGKLTLLREILLSWNQLSGSIPSEIGELTALPMLSLRENILSGSLPTEVGKLSSLVILALDTNAFSGSIPSEIGNLSALVSLDVSLNALSGTIPSEIGKLSSLERLFTHDNALSGPIPSEIGKLSSNLLSLGLQASMLSGNIPSEIGKLSSAGMIYLYQNALTGPIPSEIGMLNALTDLIFHINALSGSIPSEIGKLSALRRIYLSANALSGSIPSEIGNLSAMATLDLHTNALSGSAPTEIGKLTSLGRIYAHVNALSGPLPSEIGNLSLLSKLFFYDNALSGRIPSEIGDLGASLKELVLHSNTLSGEIPSEIGNLENLEVLDLGWNDLNGTLPTEIGNWGPLRKVFLNNNNFMGKIPSEIGILGSLGALKGLYLFQNALSGSLPSEIGYLTALTDLSLNTNSLTGEILSEIGLLGNLLHLDMGNNNLKGTLGTEIGLLTNLQFLTLGGNQLSGTLPTELLQLTKLRKLDLSGNLFSEEEVNNVMAALGLVFSCNETTVELALTAEKSMAETTWEITTANGTVVAAAGGYSFQNTPYDVKVCVPSDACTFIFLNEYRLGSPRVEVTRLGKVYQIDRPFTGKVMVDICA